MEFILYTYVPFKENYINNDRHRNIYFETNVNFETMTALIRSLTLIGLVLNYPTFLHAYFSLTAIEAL